MPLVSVLMAVRNYPGVVTALWSLHRQTFTDYEIVVVDDASDDHKTREMLDKWITTLPMRVYRSPHQVGLTGCLALGLQHCRGRYIARQDADDMSARDRLRRQVEYLGQHPSVVAVGTRVAYLDRSLRFRRRQSRLSIVAPTWQLRLGRNPFCHGSLMMRREALLYVGGYWGMCHYAQDVDLLLRLSRVGRLAILPEILYHVGQHSGQVSRQHRGEQRAWATVARWAHLFRS